MLHLDLVISQTHKDTLLSLVQHHFETTLRRKSWFKTTKSLPQKWNTHTNTAATNKKFN